MNKEPKEIKITPVVEVIYKAIDNSFLPNREIKEYWTLDGRKIGQFDLLDEFPFIKEWPSSAVYSADNKKDTERK